MRLIAINSAEAVFEPFFDKQLSDLDQWTIDAPGATGVSQSYGWAFVIIQWTKAQP